MEKQHKFAVTISPAAMSTIEAGYFSAPGDSFFASREQAQDWCNALNECIGKPWFIVEARMLVQRRNGATNGRRSNPKRTNGRGFSIGLKGCA